MSDGLRSYCKLCQKEWHISNRDRELNRMKNWKSNNTDAIKEYQKQWQKINLYKRREFRHRKEAILSKLPSTLTADQIEDIFAHFDNKCALTGSHDDIQLDHFIAVNTGHVGTIHGNMIPLTKPINISKHANNPFEWIKTQPNISEERFNDVVSYLAHLCGMSDKEYKDFVYWCFDNPINPDNFPEGDVIDSVYLFRKRCDKSDENVS
jgi:hypothetical protein